MKSVIKRSNTVDERLREIRSRVKGEPERPGYTYRISGLCEDIKFLLRQMPKIKRLKKENAEAETVWCELRDQLEKIRPGEYYITHTCDCGNEIKHRCLDMSHDIPEIPLMSMGQTDFTCNECDKSYAVGDIDVLDVAEIFG